MNAIEKVGDDESAKKRVTCKDCGSILQYLPIDIKQGKESHQGDVDYVYYIECPCCKNNVRVKR